MRTGHGVYAMYSIADKRSIGDVEYYLDMTARTKGSAFPVIIVGYVLVESADTCLIDLYLETNPI